MRIFRVPLRLRLLTMMMLLLPVLAGIEVVLVAKAPWWDVPYRSMAIWSFAVLLLAVPLSIWMANGRRWAILTSGALISLWVLFSAYLAVTMGTFWLGVFSLSLAAYGFLAIFVISREIRQPFLASPVKWYQSYPQQISGLTCSIEGVPSKAFGDPFLVSRLDRKGVFAYKRSGIPAETGDLYRISRKSIRLNFKYRNQTLACSGQLVGMLESGFGVGFRFFGNTHDKRKEIGDFVEFVKGMGSAE